MGTSPQKCNTHTHTCTHAPSLSHFPAHEMAGIDARIAMIKKYRLATRRNCSYRLRGKKVMICIDMCRGDGGRGGITVRFRILLSPAREGGERILLKKKRMKSAQKKE